MHIIVTVTAWADRVHFICSLTAWGCQGAHNGPCDSLGWQGGDFAFSASFLILNEIMPPGRGMHVSPIELSDFENAAPDCCLLVRIRSRSRASSSNGLMPGDEERSFMSLRATEEEF